MSKQCDKCGATNYDSATICTRCGSLFKDGAYSLNNQQQIQRPNSFEEKKNIEKTSKALMMIIAIIIVLIAVLVIVVVVSVLGNSDKAQKSEDSVAVASTTGAFSSEENNASVKSNIVSGLNNLSPQEQENFVPVTSLSVSDKSVTLNPGNTKTVTVTVQPDNAYSKDVEWRTDDEGIASIASYDNTCEITAVSEGKTVIYVYALGVGDKQVYQTITVKVEPATTQPQKVLPDNEDYYEYGDYFVNAKTYLSLRLGPDTSYAEVARLKTNEIVTVTAEQNDDYTQIWYFVHCNNQVGWVLGKYLTECSD
jgi:flagellar basal body-associated protein FliL